MKYTYAYKTSDGVRHEAAITTEGSDPSVEDLLYMIDWLVGG